MNPHHLRAFLWLRWRLLANQIARGGIVNQILLTLAAISFGLSVLVCFALAIPLGYFLLSEAPPLVMMLIWDGIVVVFLMFWMVGLLAELQRSEALTLEKFLHLPVSLWGVFFLNYLSSLFSLTLMIIVPTVIGLLLGLIFKNGPAMLPLLPLAAAFFFMVTAVTYQFQGWLASLMQDKRRRRTIIVVVTVLFVVIFQTPNLINILRPWESPPDEKRGAELKKEQEQLSRDLAARKITWQEYQERSQELTQREQQRETQRWKEMYALVEEIAWPINAALPIGWLPLGAHGAAEGNVLPALLGTLGLMTIGGASLWRSYLTTLRLYTGSFTSGSKTPTRVGPKEPIVRAPAPTSAGIVGWQLPGISEHASAVALAGLRSLLRAPEAKMLILSPVIMVIIYGGILLRGDVELPIWVRPAVGFGAISMVLFTLGQLIGNQFGFDRDGFRVYVLSPTPRRDILLGKNLAMLPFTFVLVASMITFAQIMQPMRLDHLLAMLPQFVTMFLLFCLIANLLSILAPMPIAQGTMRPTNTKLLSTFLHMVCMMLLPVMFAPTLIPWGVEALLEYLELIEGAPIYLGLALVECALVIGIYAWVLRWEGELLHRFEQRVLETVASKAE